MLLCDGTSALKTIGKNKTARNPMSLSVGFEVEVGRFVLPLLACEQKTEMSQNAARMA